MENFKTKFSFIRNKRSSSTSSHLQRNKSFRGKWSFALKSIRIPICVISLAFQECNASRFHLRFGKNTPKRGIRAHIRCSYRLRWFGISVTLVCGNLYRYTCERRYLNRNLEINVSSPCSKRVHTALCRGWTSTRISRNIEIKTRLLGEHDDDTFSARTISATAFSSIQIFAYTIVRNRRM